MMKRPTAFLPVVMSLASIALVLGHIVTSGVAPQPDEGTAAHLFQLLMITQVPIVTFFALKWVPRARRQALEVLALQAAAALAAFAPVYLLKW